LGVAAVAAETGLREWAVLADGLLAAAHERIAAGPVPSEPHPTPTGFEGLDMMMTLVGTGAEVYRATRSEKAAATVAWGVQQMESTFIRGADVLELAPDGPALEDTLLARHRTPGHVLEACWFLLDAADTIPASLRPGTDLFDPARLSDIAARAFDLGWDEEMGGLLCFVDKDGGEPRGRALGDRLEKLVVATWDTKLWWPNAEALYTLLLLGLRAGRDDLLERHARLHDYVMATFPAGPGKEWIQIRDRAGKPVNQIVALPVKDPFHLPRVLIYLIQCAERMAKAAEVRT
jgi:N-acylglucosamine 2-epimerase